MSNDDSRDAATAGGDTLFDNSFQNLNVNDDHDGEEHEGARTDEEYAQSPLTLRAIVSSKEAGVIIGKAGKNVADLRDETGVKAGVSKVVPGVHDRVLTVTGALEGVARAYAMVASTLLDSPLSTINTVPSGQHRMFPILCLWYTCFRRNICTIGNMLIAIFIQLFVSLSPIIRWVPSSVARVSRSNISKTYPVPAWLPKKRCSLSLRSVSSKSKAILLPSVLLFGKLVNVLLMTGKEVPGRSSTTPKSVPKAARLPAEVVRGPAMVV